MNNKLTVSAVVSPIGSMNFLSNQEVKKLHDSSTTGLYNLFRQCALAVLNCESQQDDARLLLSEYCNFNINILPQPRGLKLELINAPAMAFVNGELIKGVREHLFAVVRDILFSATAEQTWKKTTDLNSTEITNLIFTNLRHAQVFVPKRLPNIVVCWGGHSINEVEYQYTKLVGYQLGLLGFDICTGCGPGAMKGPMKGAYIGHAKQRINNSRFIGITEPEIIAAESPNPIVNELIILPDIEKRLEAFVRLGHAIIVFPGGPGTAEEILYLLGVLLDKKNTHIKVPLILTGPESASGYFEQIDQFIKATLGEDASALYEIIIDNPKLVAKKIKSGVDQVTNFRQDSNDAYHFNWQLNVDREFQIPFSPTHENMTNLLISFQQSPQSLAVNLRRLMSGIVAGNIKEPAISAIEKHGPFYLNGDISIMNNLDKLLSSFIKQNRMKIEGKSYKPCYIIKS